MHILYFILYIFSKIVFHILQKRNYIVLFVDFNV